jgi:hypothetical protein
MYLINSIEFPIVHELIKHMIYSRYLMNLMQLRGVDNRGGGRLMRVGVSRVSRDLGSVGLMEGVSCPWCDVLFWFVFSCLFVSCLFVCLFVCLLCVVDRRSKNV